MMQASAEASCSGKGNVFCGAGRWPGLLYATAILQLQVMCDRPTYENQSM